MPDALTYSYKKIDHKKYVEGKVDLLSDIVAPLLASFHTVAEKSAPSQLYREEYFISCNIHVYNTHNGEGTKNSTIHKT